jgi:hypothetical protein
MRRAVVAKQNLDGYMAKLEQELAARKQSTSSPADSLAGSSGNTDGSPSTTDGVRQPHAKQCNFTAANSTTATEHM